MTRFNIAVLDYTRGIAAVAVVLGHARSFVEETLGYSLFSSSNVWQKILLIPTIYGVDAVAVFFVLSGFLVGGQALSQSLSNNFRLNLFFASRLGRLYAVLFPGLALTALCGVITGTHESLNWWTFFCNLGFAMPVRCGNFGGNSPLWSLGYEFWFYLLFAGVTGLFVRKSFKSGAILTIAPVLLFGPQLLILFPAWLLGVATAFLDSRLPQLEDKTLKILVGLAGTCLFVQMCALSWIQASKTTTILLDAPMTGLLLFGLVRLTRQSPHRKFRLLDSLASMSFSLYVVHYPLMQILFANEVGANLPPLLRIWLFTLIVLPVAHLFYRAFERHTHILKHRIGRMLGVPSNQAT